MHILIECKIYIEIKWKAHMFMNILKERYPFLIIIHRDSSSAS